MNLPARDRGGRDECRQCGRKTVHHHAGPDYELRYQPDGLDEIVATGKIQLMREDDDHLWLRIMLADGTRLVVTIRPRRGHGRVDQYVEIDDPADQTVPR